MPRCNFDTLSEAREFVRALGVTQVDAERLIQALAEVSRPRSVVVRLQAALRVLNHEEPEDDGMGGDG